MTFHGVNYDSTSYSEPREASDAPYSKLNISSIVSAPSENSSKRSKRRDEDTEGERRRVEVERGRWEYTFCCLGVLTI